MESKGNNTEQKHYKSKVTYSNVALVAAFYQNYLQGEFFKPDFHFTAGKHLSKATQQKNTLAALGLQFLRLESLQC